MIELSKSQASDALRHVAPGNSLVDAYIENRFADIAGGVKMTTVVSSPSTFSEQKIEK